MKRVICLIEVFILNFDLCDLIERLYDGFLGVVVLDRLLVTKNRIVI